MLGRRRAYEVHQFAIRHLQILGPMAQHLSSIIQICIACPAVIMKLITRSEEHTSELQSLMRISYAVFCLKKKHQKQTTTHTHTIYISPTHNENTNAYCRLI